jgi:2-polyprenyl-3-methyl-5-hydroxy-6-metoxy-1,4-benzoquinol methylase
MPKPDLPSSTRTRVRRVCIACGSHANSRLYRNELARIAGLDLSYDVVQCQRCHAAYADGIAEPADYSAYYQHCSKYDRIATLEDIAAIDRRRAEFTGTFAAANLPVLDRVLDLGCGSGVLLAQLRELGARRLCGIDPAPHAPESAQRLFGIGGVRHGTIVEADRYFAIAEFDLICLTAVLEHLADPLATLRGLAAHMAPKASLLVEVPALEAFARPPLEPHGELSIEHINYFSQESLTDLAARAGLRPMASAVLQLWPLGADSVFVLFGKSPGAKAVRAPGEVADGTTRGLMGAYLAESARALEPVLARAAAALRGGDAVLWGAGSHSARLLPMLESLGVLANLRAVVDSNPNLQGRTLGRHVVRSIEALAEWPKAAVIVSSFRSSAAIASRLRAHFPNPVCELYDVRTGDRP